MSVKDWTYRHTHPGWTTGHGTVHASTARQALRLVRVIAWGGPGCGSPNGDHTAATRGCEAIEVSPVSPASGWRRDLAEALDVRRPGPAQHARLRGLVMEAVQELGAGGEHVAARAVAESVTRQNAPAIRRIKRALAQLVSTGRLVEAKRSVHDGQRKGGKANGFALPPEDIVSPLGPGTGLPQA